MFASFQTRDGRQSNHLASSEILGNMCTLLVLKQEGGIAHQGLFGELCERQEFCGLFANASV